MPVGWTNFVSSNIVHVIKPHSCKKEISKKLPRIKKNLSEGLCFLRRTLRFMVHPLSAANLISLYISSMDPLLNEICASQIVGIFPTTYLFIRHKFFADYRKTPYCSPPFLKLRSKV